MDLLTACEDENLFRPWFKDPSTWVAWRAFIAACFGLEMLPEEREIYTRCTARARPPSHPCDEAWVIAGRRSGKSFILALIAVYLACFKDWRPYLSPGERATVMTLASDRRQSRVIMRYISALLHEVPMLAALIESERRNQEDLGFDLSNRVTIEVHASSFRSVRGYTCCAALLDEVAFWRSDDSANPDAEVLAAIRPALATVEGSMLLAASSPYAKKGVLWEAHRRYFATESPVLVWQAPTEVMNPTVSRRTISEAEERDPASAESEWHARFRSDLESFVSREAVLACVEAGTRERPPVLGVSYVGFCDPSGGRDDAMTLGIAHREDGGVAVLDLLREVRPPFDPSSVAREFSATLKSYGLSHVTGDRYAAAWVETEFRRHGVACQVADRAKSELYRSLLPMINSRQAVLLGSDRLVAQLVSLERRVGRAGKDSIDHPAGAGSHDDLANSCAGSLVLAASVMTWPLVW